MNHVALLSLSALLLAGPIAAQVYKGIGADGRPFYSDRPIPDATPVTLPGLSTGNVTGATPDPAAAASADRALGFRGSYDDFEMLTPAEGFTARDAQGRVPVGLLLAPGLKAGHQISVEVDGVAVGGVGTEMQFELKGLTLGSHRVQALIVDDAGVPAAASATVNVHIRPPLPEGSLRQ